MSAKIIRQNWHLLAVALVVFSLILSFILVNQSTPRLALFLIFGAAFGFILGRSRFCFVSGFANFFLFRDGSILKAVVVGMAVATIGFTFVMYNWVADPSSGSIPPGAHAGPVGWHLALAGLVFGFGMMITGACITGSLFRTAGGFVYALVAIFGIIVGMGIFLHTRFLWDATIANSPQVWLPNHIGWPASVILMLGLLGAIYFIITVLQPREVKEQALESTNSGDKSVKGLPEKLKSINNRVFVKHWPIIAGGILLGLLNVLLYWQLDRPWGVSGEFQRWGHLFFDFIRLTPPEVAAVPGT